MHYTRKKAELSLCYLSTSIIKLQHLLGKHQHMLHSRCIHQRQPELYLLAM
jgi:hypothetical protein